MVKFTNIYFLQYYQNYFFIVPFFFIVKLSYILFCRSTQVESLPKIEIKIFYKLEKDDTTKDNAY